MKYVVCDEGRNGWGDIFTKEFDNKNDAIEEARDQWCRLTNAEKEKRHIYVLESVNPDPESVDHLDGNHVWKCEHDKKYMNFDTGEVWKYSEIKDEYEKFKGEMSEAFDTFEDYLEHELVLGRNKEGGYIEVN